MSKEFVKIEDFLEDSNYLEISGYSKNEVVPEGGDPTKITLATHSEVYRELMYNYGERAILVRDDEDAETVFTNLFTDWEKRRGDDIATLVDAYNRLYNPIENYDRTDEHTGYDTELETPDEDGRYHEITQTPTGWKKESTQEPTNWKTEETQEPTNWKTEETQTPTNWKTEEKENKQQGASNTGKVVNKVVPVNGSTAQTVSETENDVNSLKSTEQLGSFKTTNETSGSYKTTSEQSGSFKTTDEQKGTFKTKDELVGTLEMKKTYNSQLRAHGNIGMASAQDLLEKELKVRMVDILKTVILEFINEYTVYA